MLFLQKIISNLILSPSLLIILLIFFSFCIKKFELERKLIFRILIALSIFIYIFSIELTKDIILKPLESKYNTISKENIEESDVYILLGGGILENAPLSMREAGIPTETSMVRLVEVLRLYNISKKKIIVSGGKVLGKKLSEASVYKKFLVDMGVEEGDIIVEGRSRTTAENSLMTKKIMDEYLFESAVLITSASHMYRSVKSFERKNIKVIPAPCGYVVDYGTYGIMDFMPRVSNIELITRGLWEYLGYIYYALRRV